MKVVAIMQNQWFKNPASAERTLANCVAQRGPAGREWFIARMLFMGCRTGQILQACLGEEWCERIVWEEASPKIGGHAASKFPADRAHIEEVIRRHSPRVLLAFGKVAADPVVRLCGLGCTYILLPHPCARGVDTREPIRGARQALDILWKQNAPKA